MKSRLTRSALATAVLYGLAANALAEPGATQSVEIAQGALSFSTPSEWVVVAPANNLIEREFSAPAPEGVDAKAARLTVMAAGGSIDANLARWTGQFQNTEGGADRSGAEIERLTANGMKITTFDMSGVFMEGRPFGPKTPRPDYRMVAAIVETESEGNYFFKLVGPEAAVGPAAEAFRESVLSLHKTE